jgi:hypothetical protein
MMMGVSINLHHSIFNPKRTVENLNSMIIFYNPSPQLSQQIVPRLMNIPPIKPDSIAKKGVGVWVENNPSYFLSIFFIFDIL